MAVPPPVPPPAVIMTDVKSEPARVPQIVTYRTSAVRCADETVTPLRLETPYPSIRMLYRPSWGQLALAPYLLTFNIGADGRPRAIRGGYADPNRDYDPSIDVLAAA